MALWSARPRRCSSTSRVHRGRCGQPAQLGSGGVAARAPPRRARPAASRRRGWRSRASGGPRSPAGRAGHRHAVQPLARARAHAAAGRDALDEAHQLQVEERHAQLEPGWPSTSCRCRSRIPSGRNMRVSRYSACSSRPRPGTSASTSTRAPPARPPPRRPAPGASAPSHLARRSPPPAAAAAPRRRGRRARGPRAARAAARGSAPGHRRSGAGQPPRARDEARQHGGRPVAAVAAVRLVRPLARRAPPSPAGAKRESWSSAGADGMPHGSSRRGTQRDSSARKSSSSIAVAWWSVPIRRALSAASAARRACRRGPGKPIVNVVGGSGAERAAMAATTAGRVHAARQERSVRDVGHHLAADRVGRSSLGQLAPPATRRPGPSTRLAGRLAEARDPRLLALAPP